MAVRRALLVGLTLALALRARPAAASAADVFGLGSAETGVAGASAARVRDFSAGYYDPAALVGVRAPEASFGLLGFGSSLRVRASDGEHGAPMTDPVGILIGAATPVPFTGVLADRLFVGLALYLLPDSIVRVIAHAPEQPFFPLYDNRTQRLIVLPSLAARLWRGLSIGIGINYLAGLSGNVSAAPGATRAIEARVDEAIFAHAAVNAAVRWQVRQDVALALVYRQEFSVPFRTVSRNTVAGQPIDLDVDAEGLFTPHQLVLGGAWQLGRALLSLDLAWSHWSDWRGPYVTVTSELPLVGGIDARPPRLDYDDTFALRAGFEWLALARGRAQLRLRAGYGFETSPIPADQPATTNLLDGNKHRVAVGVGGRVRAFGGALRLDAHAQVDALQPASLHGGAVRGEGAVWAGGFTLTVER
jgi:long-chain fatty acid transport protein